LLKGKSGTYTPLEFYGIIHLLVKSVNFLTEDCASLQKAPGGVIFPFSDTAEYVNLWLVDSD